MKKRLFIWMILLVLILSGCAKNEGMYVEPAQLTQEEEEIAELLGLNTEHRIFDFVLDDTVQTVSVHVYELENGGWSQISGGGGLDFSDCTSGRIALGFDRIASGVRIALQSDKNKSITSYKTETEEESLGRATTVLHDRTEVVYDQEIPLVLQIETAKNEIRSYDVSYFNSPEEYEKAGYEHVYAITILFSQEALS
mgnify:CR=1 FL=1|jgi:hypothetical protein